MRVAPETGVPPTWLTLRVSPSTSMSRPAGLVMTLPVAGVVSVLVRPLVSSRATGASLTGVTMMLTVLVAVPPWPSEMV